MTIEFNFLPRPLAEKYGFYNPTLEEAVVEINKWALECDVHTQVNDRFRLNKFEQGLYELLIREQLALSKSLLVRREHPYYDTLDSIYIMFREQTEKMIEPDNKKKVKPRINPFCAHFLRRASTQIAEVFMSEDNSRKEVELNSTALMFSFQYDDLRRELNILK